jgi:hypothetical protein
MSTATLPSVWLSFIYPLARRVLEGVLVHQTDTLSKDAEILVLRHQLAVLRRRARAGTLSGQRDW